MTQALPLVLFVFVMYFLLWRPQQRRQKEHTKMLETLKKGTIVRTTGGIRGEIFEVTERDATLMVADRVKINILRSHIAGLDQPVDSKAKSGSPGAAGSTKADMAQEKSKAVDVKSSGQDSAGDA